MRRAPDAAAETFPDGRTDTAAGRFRRTLRQTVLPIAGQLLLAYLLLTAVWTGLGRLLTGPLAGGWVDGVDRDVAQWLVDQRTPPLDTWSQVGSLLAETMVKVVVTAVVAVVLLIVLRSWREPFLVAFALVLEASVFITVTFLVGRPRPQVPALEEVSVDTSFPSGHVAAAAAYAAMAIVVFEHTRRVWIRAVTVILVIAVPVVVGAGRMYRGVHYLTDAVGGALLGVACVLVVYLIARRGRTAGRSSTGGPPTSGPGSR